MTRFSTYRAKAADMLSTLLLLLAVLLAGGAGAAGYQGAAGSAAPLTTADGLGKAGNRSTPVLAKQRLLVSEAKDDTSGSSDDGKSKKFLASGPFFIAAPSSGAASDAPLPASQPANAASPFDARGPPAIS